MKTFLFGIIYLVLILSSTIVYSQESDRDAIARYRKLCTPLVRTKAEEKPEDAAAKKAEAPKKVSKEEMILIDSRACAALGELFEKLGQDAMARKAYVRGCKANEMLSCLRLGYLTELAEDGGLQKAKKYYKIACDNDYLEGCERLKQEEESNFLANAAVALIGILIFFITRTIFQEESQFKASEKIEDAGLKDEAKKHGIVLRYSRPFFRRYISPVVGTLKWKKQIREKYKSSLATAGLTGFLTPDDFFSFKLFLIIGFPIVYLGVRIFLEADWPLAAVPFIAVGGFFYPDMWIKGKIQARQKEVILQMPFAVDMLALSVEAGLDFIAAMTKVVEKAKPGALTEELEILLKEIKVGASRAEALRNMSERIDLIQVASFAATLIAADSVGASIGPILKNLSAEIRQKKSADAEKAGATAATKILFPMLFLIVPAVFIMIAAPIALELMGAQ